MTVSLTEAEAQEARSLLDRLGALLGPRETPAAPALPLPHPSTLAPGEFIPAAQRLACEVATLIAVWQVESTGHPFGFDGRPTLLFEPHKFSELTHHRFDATQGGVSYPKWGQKPYPKGTADHRHTANWDRLIYAASLDKDAAYKSASYGAPQIMGFNFAACGYADVHAFVAGMSKSEATQLDAFVALILDWKLDDEMRERRWADFARRYNGPRFAENAYDVKLEAAYRAALG